MSSHFTFIKNADFAYAGASLNGESKLSDYQRGSISTIERNSLAKQLRSLGIPFNFTESESHIKLSSTFYQVGINEDQVSVEAPYQDENRDSPLDAEIGEIMKVLMGFKLKGFDTDTEEEVTELRLASQTGTAADVQQSKYKLETMENNHANGDEIKPKRKIKIGGSSVTLSRFIIVGMSVKFVILLVLLGWLLLKG